MFVYAIILLLIVIGLWIYQNNKYVKFEIENDHYQIEKTSPNKMESLQTLLQLRKKLEQLIAHLLKKYPNDQYVIRLKQRFSNTVLREANPDGDPSQTSYTINKGDTIVICLRSNNSKLVDLNTLTYVSIHELAHIYSSSFQHSDEFWRNMRFLVDEAISINLYEPINYINNPVRYCGIIISSNIPGSKFDKNNNQKGGSPKTLIDFLLSRSGVF